MRILTAAFVGVFVVGTAGADTGKCPLPARDPNLRVTCGELEAGSNPVETSGGSNPSMWTPIAEAARVGDVTTVRRLLLVPATTQQMRTDAAFAAISFKQTEVLRALLDAGLSPNSRSASGEPLVVQASVSANVEALRLLFEKGADLRVRMPKSTGDALIIAIAGHQREVIRFLMETGTDWSASVTEKGQSPRQLAELLHDSCALELLQVPFKANGKTARY